MSNLIDRHAAIIALCQAGCESGYCGVSCDDVKAIESLPSVVPGGVIMCKDCKYWKRQNTGYGYCESNSMWLSLEGEITEVSNICTDEYHYCGYAERRTD